MAEVCIIDIKFVQLYVALDRTCTLHQSKFHGSQVRSTIFSLPSDSCILIQSGEVEIGYSFRDDGI